MKKCRCNFLVDELWADLVNSVTIRYVDQVATFKAVYENLTPDELATARLIARFEKRPVRDVVVTVASYCDLRTAKEEFEDCLDEIVRLSELSVV